MNTSGSVLEKPTSEKFAESQSPAPVSRTNRLFRNLVIKGLQKLNGGSITILDGCETLSLGSQNTDRLSVIVTVLDDSFYQDVIFKGSLGVAEAYLQGKWICSDLTQLIQIFCRNLEMSENLNRGLSQIALQFAKAAHRFAHNSLQGSRKNIAAHYDLSNEFFQIFLDPTMMYSSAYYSQPEMSLEQASQDKLELICRRLELKESDHLLEVGTGWGGLACYAAKNYGCQITTTTISNEQYQLAKQKLTEQGVSDKVRLISQDYRELAGQYDKIVSIEMIEAVGKDYLGGYFKKCSSLLKPGGKFLVQAITIPDQRYDAYCKSVDFINNYIFPGGHLPSIGAMQAAASNGTDLRLISLEDFGESYALTLREWRRRFFESIDEVQHLGFDERFIRMWDYYLCYCEGAFLEKSVGVSHLLWQSTNY